jgi:hypothetical protein
MEKREKSMPQIQLKAYSKKEVANLYEISGKTLQTWLTPLENELGPRVGRFYTPKQVKIMFEEFGIPKVLFSN